MCKWTLHNQRRRRHRHPDQIANCIAACDTLPIQLETNKIALKQSFQIKNKEKHREICTALILNKQRGK